MKRKLTAWMITAGLAGGLVAFAQPPNGGNNQGPRPLPGLTTSENAAFQEGLKRFLEVDSVTGTQPGATGSGLGPVFNLNSCSGCHAQPFTGGTSPSVNPQVALATAYGATNPVPSFIHSSGPARAVRFVSDGGVHSLFSITGRHDAVGCTVVQPNFEAEFAKGNAVFRIPTPLFGAGLIESIMDASILANKAANAQAKANFGIAGHENRNGNDGTITRFGWKAQNKSLLLFAGEAYNVEIGVTNEIFPTERVETAGCTFNATPEDHTNFTQTSATTAMSDILGFTQFMRWLAPLQTQPPVGASPQSIQNGQQDFANAGCALCHTPSFTTGKSTSASLSQKPVNLYSDLLVHRMGTGLADGIVQGTAAADEFRSAPLWGVGARLFFLHDGRATDLTTAIQAHQSTGSEANASVAAFNKLTTAQQADLLNFLKSL